MTRAIVVEPKRSDEKVPVTFPFGDLLLFGETISGQAVTCVVFTGEDENPENVLFGGPSVSGVAVTQIVEGGVPGTIYQLICAVTGSGGHVYTKGAKLAIVNSPASYTGS